MRRDRYEDLSLAAIVQLKCAFINPSFSVCLPFKARAHAGTVRIQFDESQPRSPHSVRRPSAIHNPFPLLGVAIAIGSRQELFDLVPRLNICILEIHTFCLERIHEGGKCNAGIDLVLLFTVAYQIH